MYANKSEQSTHGQVFQSLLQNTLKKNPFTRPMQKGEELQESIQVIINILVWYLYRQRHYQDSQEQKRDLDMIDEYMRNNPDF